MKKVILIALLSLFCLILTSCEVTYDKEGIEILKVDGIRTSHTNIDWGSVIGLSIIIIMIIWYVIASIHNSRIEKDESLWSITTAKVVGGPKKYIDNTNPRRPYTSREYKIVFTAKGKEYTKYIDESKVGRLRTVKIKYLKKRPSRFKVL